MQRRPRIGTLAVVRVITEAVALSAQASGAAVLEPDFVYNAGAAQLGGVRQLAVGDGSVIYVLDRYVPGIVRLDKSGDSSVVLGAAGEGPGEFRGLWRIGTTRDGVWGADARLARVTLFSNDGSVRVFRVDVRGLGPGRVVPVGLTDDMAVLATWQPPGRDETVHLIRVESDGLAKSLYVGSVEGRVIAVPFQSRTGEGFVPNPFYSGEILAIPSNGCGYVLVDTGLPDDGVPAYWIRWYGSDGSRLADVRVRYDARRLRESDVALLLEESSDVVAQWVERGLFSSEETARAAIRHAIETRTTLPPIQLAGRGIFQETVLVGGDGRVWVRRSSPPQAPQRWDVVSRPTPGSSPVTEASALHVRIPAGVRLLDADAQYVWGVKQNALNLPTIVRYRIREADG